MTERNGKGNDMNVEHPGQILTLTTWRERVATDYAGGTVDAPTTLYLTSAGTTLGPALLLEPWSNVAQRVTDGRIARALVRGDESHRNGCASGVFRNWERDTCGTCALLGWFTNEADPVPNYAGWGRVYIQAREPIPRAWLSLFVAELNDEENTSYRDALRRDVATYGYRLTDEQPGYRLPTPTAAKMLAWLRDYHGADNVDAIRAQLEEIANDHEGEYHAASYRAARAALDSLEPVTTTERGTE